MESNKVFLEHILNETGFIVESIKNFDKDSFYHDEFMKSAVTQSIEIIGDAIKNISDELKNQYPDVEWKKIADERDRLIHGYFAEDYDIIWEILINKIPLLQEQIQEILEKLN